MGKSAIYNDVVQVVSVGFEHGDAFEQANQHYSADV